MFLTLEDPRAKIKGSRDPLGMQPIWSKFGREVVTNLTTVTRAVRGFTVTLLGRYYGERLIEDERASEEDAVAIFLRLEQIAAYARRSSQSEHSTDSVLGITRVERFFSEYNGKVPIRNDATGYILSDQKTYGLWGLYSVAARVSGLLAEGPVGLTARATEFVESEYLPHLQSNERKLVSLILRGGILDTRRNQEPFRSMAKVLASELTEVERDFYRSALRDARQVQRPTAAERQQQLAALIVNHCEAATSLDRPAIEALSHAAGQNGSASLAEKLQRILRLEATLATADTLFELVLARNGASPATLAQHVQDHWGGHVPNLDSSIEPLLHEIQLAAGDEQTNLLKRCDHALSQGDYREAIESLLEWNQVVMAGRGAAPWVRLTGGEIDVRFRGVESRMPTGDELPQLWRNSYFIDSLKGIAFQLEPKN